MTWPDGDGKAWMPRTRDSYRSLALNVLPRQNRFARHAKSVMDHAEMQGQIGPDSWGIRPGSHRLEDSGTKNLLDHFYAAGFGS